MFKKDKGYVLDIPDLHRKKLIKLPEIENSEISKKITNDGFFDMSKTKEPSSQTSFLSDFASIGASNQVTPKNIEKVESTEDIKDLKWRLENLEFKLEQLIERIDSMNKQI